MRIASAIFVFLLSIFNSEDIKQNPELAASSSRGKEIYVDFCLQCHLSNGKGTLNIVPPLANSDYLQKNRKESIRAIKFGQQGKIKVNGITYEGIMPNPNLTDDEVADVMNYINNSWGNQDSKMVTVDEVKSIKKQE